MELLRVIWLVKMSERPRKAREVTPLRKANMIAYVVHPSVAHVRDIYKPNPEVVEEAVEASEHANEGGQPLDKVFIHV
jgi:hypothetical protein